MTINTNDCTKVKSTSRKIRPYKGFIYKYSAISAEEEILSRHWQKKNKNCYPGNSIVRHK